ncbi:hypothetical protein PEPS_20690 [Persicobacter psychrovividus]|uniref:histidine kinase n=1 Tax=Persicobacter psychrovividus TaxID=387638 RepID=A0ABN6LEE7_9BACT|nr:hypothetical protein PEPS_20690 [Persicobacter psychrovividus]
MVSTFQLFSKQIKIYHLRWLLISGIGLLLAIFLEKGAVGQFQYPKAYTEQIQTKLNAELKKVNAEMSLLRDQIQEDGYFNAEHLGDFTPTYPTTIYLNGKLIYWSDQTFVPSYKEVAGNYRYHFREVARRESILSRRTLEKGSIIYEIVEVIPLKVKAKTHITYQGKTYNEKIFTNKLLHLKAQYQSSKFRIFAPNGNFLCGIQYEMGYRREMADVYYLIWLVIFLSIACFIRFVWINAQYLAQAGHFDFGLLFLVTALVGGRLPLLFSRETFAFNEIKIFDPKIFASSFLNPSLGDLILNLFFLCIVVNYIFSHYYRSGLVRYLFRQSSRTLHFYGLIFTFFVFELGFFVFNIFESINYHSQSSFSIGVNLLWDNFMVFSYLCVALSAMAFMLGESVLLKLISKFFYRQNILSTSLIWLGGMVLALLNNNHFDFTGLAVVCTVGVLVLLSWRWRNFRKKGSISYATVLYLFLGTIIVSVLGTISVQKYQSYNLGASRERFINNLNVENDIIGEYLLQRVGQTMSEDAWVSRLITHPKQLVKFDDEYFQRRFLNDYFDKYTAQFYFFDRDGLPISVNNTETLDRIRVEFRKTMTETDYPSVYQLKDASFGANLTYSCVFTVRDQGGAEGYVVIKLVHQDLNQNSVFPLLLMHEKKKNNSYDESKFSYADFAFDELQFQSGAYNYAKFFNQDLLQNPALYESGVVVNGYRHIGIREKENRVRVVTHAVYGLYDLYTDFAYIFLIMILLASLVVVSFGFLMLSQNVKLNFVAKIQIYLNSAFLVPLLALSVTTLSMMVNTSKRSVISSYSSKAEGLANNLNEVMVRYHDRIFDKKDIVAEIAKVANISSLDIALYDVRGKLITSNQPMIFQRQLLSNHINPKALRALVFEGEQKVVFDEYAGDYEYKQVYVALRSALDGTLMGIIGVPFFPVNPISDPLLNEGVNSIINLFTVIFIIFLSVAFFASRWLTYPMTLLAQRIRQTNLTSLDQPLHWRSDDEIGALVKEYNRMLRKLSDNKLQMAQTEKQSAWREMAQQVAHEIKNPLTPMKLRLQYMQMVMSNSEAEEVERIRGAIDMLLGQVDTLSEIATSFSEFAKMPMPIKETFNFSTELRRVIELHRTPERGQLVYPEIPDQMMVEGDQQLIGRTLSNLIINGFQAVSSDVEPLIELQLADLGEVIEVAIKDNGVGIAEDIQSKVFLPNFSTKFSGSGIGLAIAKRGIEHAGGKIWFDSEEGKGTTFFVQLPKQITV